LDDALVVATARELFAARGYAGVEFEELARAAGITRAQLASRYPGGKEEVFGAVAVDVSGETARAVRAAALGGDTPLAALERGIDAFLDACTDPAVRRVLLLDTPAVLGREVWQALDAEYALQLLEDALQRAIDAGQLPVQPVRAAAHVLLGALEQAAGAIASADDPDAARAEMAPTVSRLLEGLRAPLG
jgi:AcrR family transcriptional regulator